MKKSILIVYLAILCSVLPLIAEAVARVDFIAAGTKPYPYWKFEGFRFDSYTPSRAGIESLLELEHSAIQDKEIKNSNTQKYALIGHSQGGLRVLAYPAFLKKRSESTEITVYDKNGKPETVSLSESDRLRYKAEYDNIQAVITVSGIDKGLKALDGGLGRLRSVIQNDAMTVYLGVNGVMRIDPGLMVILDVIPLTPLLELDQTRAFLIGLIPDEAGGFIKPLFYKYTNIDDVAELRDMTPNSEFIRKHVATTTDRMVRVPIGEHDVWHVTWTIFGPIPWVTREMAYTFFTMKEDVEVKIPPEMPVGYIVGRNSNTLSMANVKDPNNETYVRATCFALQNLFFAAGNLHLAQVGLGFGLINGSVTSSSECFAAATWMATIDAQMTEIVGSTESDGLVAKENQFVQKQFRDPGTGVVTYPHDNVVGSDPRGYTEFPQYNHANIFVATNKDVDDEYVIMLQQSVKQRKR